MIKVLNSARKGTCVFNSRAQENPGRMGVGVGEQEPKNQVPWAMAIGVGTASMTILDGLQQEGSQELSKI